MLAVHRIMNTQNMSGAEGQAGLAEAEPHCHQPAGSEALQAVSVSLYLRAEVTRRLLLKCVRQTERSGQLDGLSGV